MNQIFILKEVPISSKINCGDTQNIEHLLVQTIKRTSYQVSNEENEIHCDIIKYIYLQKFILCKKRE